MFIKGATPWNKGTTGNKRSGVPWNKGKTDVYSEYTLQKMAKPKTEEHRKKIGELSKGRFAGEKNFFWVDGSIKYWKRVALERDNYTCKKCGCNERDIMTVDHVKPRALFPELFKDIDNLMTLCPNCHMRKSNADRRMIYSLRHPKQYEK